MPEEIDSEVPVADVEVTVGVVVTWAVVIVGRYKFTFCEIVWWVPPLPLAAMVGDVCDWDLVVGLVAGGGCDRDLVLGLVEGGFGSVIFNCVVFYKDLFLFMVILGP